MSVEPLRVITDGWEWASIAHLVPSVYHEQSWTLASVARLKSQSSLPVAYGYARVWVGHSLIGCPLIRYGERWFNTPRARPLVLQGTQLNAAAALLRAVERKPTMAGRLELHDDSEITEAIERIRLTLDVRSHGGRCYRSMTNREIDSMVRSLDWADRSVAAEWGASVKACWRAGSWTTTVNAHYGERADTIGYSVWVARPIGTECIAAALCGAPVPAWASMR